MIQKKLSMGLMTALIMIALMGLFMTAEAFADTEVDSWDELKTALNNGGSVTLSGDITAGENPGNLVVPSGVEVVLDLNGYIIDRGSPETGANNQVITIEGGTLTLKDSGSNGIISSDGAIKGGNSTGRDVYGGGIYLK